jgi:hypothetical protein
MNKSTETRRAREAQARAEYRAAVARWKAASRQQPLPYYEPGAEAYWAAREQAERDVDDARARVAAAARPPLPGMDSLDEATARRLTTILGYSVLAKKNACQMLKELERIHEYLSPESRQSIINGNIAILAVLEQINAILAGRDS